METKTRAQVIAEEQRMTEYNLNVDGVIELPENVDAKTFFDGLLDKIIEYVEAHGAFAGLGMSYKEYQDEVADARETT
jgi:hypothetical protein